MSELTHADKFFTTARDRFHIRLRREANEPPPWTEDLIFREWKFCNVHREHDKTTIWFRENIRDPLKDDAPNVTQATTIFRWFNRIETGEIIKDLLLNGWDTEECRRRLKDVHPILTGAYKIGSPKVLNKL